MRIRSHRVKNTKQGGKIKCLTNVKLWSSCAFSHNLRNRAVRLLPTSQSRILAACTSKVIFCRQAYNIIPLNFTPDFTTSLRNVYQKNTANGRISFYKISHGAPKTPVSQLCLSTFCAAPSQTAYHILLQCNIN